LDVVGVDDDRSFIVLTETKFSMYVVGSGNLTEALPRSAPCVRCTYALTVVSFSGTGNIRISAQHIADGVSTKES
jgi:hypothetical protein